MVKFCNASLHDIIFKAAMTLRTVSIATVLRINLL